MKPIVGFVVVLGLCACAGDPRQPLRVGAAADVGQGLNNAGEATIPSGGLIVFQGDDLIYGDKRLRRDAPPVGVPARSAAAIPDQVYRRLGRRVTIQINAQPGDTLKAGLERWKGRPAGDLLVVAYAYGDAVAGTSPAEYRAGLTALVASARAAGAPVFLIAPPNASDPALQAKLDGYRDVIRSMASRGTAVFEAQQSLNVQRLPAARSAAQEDAAYVGIAGMLLEHIRIAPPRRAGG